MPHRTFISGRDELQCCNVVVIKMPIYTIAHSDVGSLRRETPEARSCPACVYTFSSKMTRTTINKISQLLRWRIKPGEPQIRQRDVLPQHTCRGNRHARFGQHDIPRLFSSSFEFLGASAETGTVALLVACRLTYLAAKAM